MPLDDYESIYLIIFSIFRACIMGVSLRSDNPSLRSGMYLRKKMSLPLSKEDAKFNQRVVGSFLYYARAIDMTILHALYAITSK